MKTKSYIIEEGVTVLDSGNNGATISVVGGIHGNEPCGIELLKYIETNLNINIGKIYCLYGNLDAIKKNIRQCDLNLNRIFKSDKDLTQEEKISIEYKHMRRIRKYLDKSDVCLDIHSSPTKGSPVFAIGEKNTFDILQHFSVKYVCSGFASIEPGGTDYYMYTTGKIGICIECGNHLDSSAFHNAENALKTLLVYYNMISHSDNTKHGCPEYMNAKIAYITKSDSFSLAKNFKDFEKIQKGQKIGHDSNEDVFAENTGYILFARDRKISGVEGFVELEKKSIMIG